MKRNSAIFLIAATLTLSPAKAAAAPIEGTWEGVKYGLKAATLTVREKDGALSGTAVFYVIQTDGDGTHKGAALPAHPMSAVRWDGKTLRFSQDFGTVLLKLLGSPNLCSRRWVYRQYDHMVMTNTVVLPGSDAAVLRIKGLKQGIAVTTDNGRSR